MSLSLHGIGVSRGCTIGKASIMQRNQPEVSAYTIPEAIIENEVQRFLAGLTTAKQQLQDMRARISANLPTDITAFIDTHLLMLEDSSLAQAPINLIRTQLCNAEWALKIQRDLVVKVFEAMDDPYLRTRKDDVDHVVQHIQRILLTDELSFADVAVTRLEGRIVIAGDLTPAETILMQQQGASAFVAEYGGPLSHAAILARSLGIPTVVGVRNARLYLRDDEIVVVDGQQGIVIGGPDEGILHHYRWKKQEEECRRRELIKLKEQPAVTRDAVKITLHANIELPEDVAAVRQVAAAGVGLYRTEFLFMNRPDVPDEEEHLSSYLHVIKTLEGIPITIRTADLGADKQVDGGRSGGGSVTMNPALGLRAIRLCLQNPELFRPQLRAILRASASGKVRIMIPMLSNVQEIFQVLRLVEDTKRELREQGQSFDEHIPVGGMVEVPAAAVCAPYFARHLDFLSIGTNDLIQYALAIDRIDDEVNYLYDPLHPAVLHLIHMTIRAGQAGWHSGEHVR